MLAKLGKKLTLSLVAILVIFVAGLVLSAGALVPVVGGIVSIVVGYSGANVAAQHVASKEAAAKAPAKPPEPGQDEGS